MGRRREVGPAPRGFGGVPHDFTPPRRRGAPGGKRKPRKRRTNGLSLPPRGPRFLAGAGKRKNRYDGFLRKHLGPRKAVPSSFLPLEPHTPHDFPTRSPQTKPRGSTGPYARSCPRAGHSSRRPLHVSTGRTAAMRSEARLQSFQRLCDRASDRGARSGVIQRASSTASRPCAPRRQIRRESRLGNEPRLVLWQGGGHRFHNNMSQQQYHNTFL